MNNDINTQNVTEKKEKGKVTPGFLNIIYVAIMIACLTLLIFLTTMTIIRVNKNNQLKQQEAEIIEKYNQLAKEADPDYANVYFENNTIYIPSQDVIIEYQP